MPNIPLTRETAATGDVANTGSAIAVPGRRPDEEARVSPVTPRTPGRTLPRAGLVAVLAGGMILTGCARTAASAPVPTLEGEGVEIIVGTHANAPAPVLPPQVVAEVAEAVDAEKFIGVIAVEGKPRELQRPLPMSVTGDTPSARRQSDRVNTAAVGRLVLDTAPATRGADLLGALVLAAKAAKAAAVPIHRLVAIDNGLSDTGPLDFTTPGLADADPNDVVSTLTRAHVLGAHTFEGLSVDLIGLGTTVAAPQPRLPQAQVRRLEAIYCAIVRAGGGVPTIIASARTGPPVRTSLTVDVVPADGGTVALGGTTALGDGSSVAFGPGTAVFRDAAAARALLRPVAEWLRPGSGHRAVLVGTTSSAGTSSQTADLALSQARANAVKDLLVELGADPARITAEGKGYIAQPADRIDGVLDPAKAAQNRIVRITTIR